VPVARSADLATLPERALELSLFHQRCDFTQRAECTVARCIGPTPVEVACDPSTKRCSDHAALPDASPVSPDAGASDASAPFDGGAFVNAASVDAATVNTSFALDASPDS